MTREWACVVCGQVDDRTNCGAIVCHDCKELPLDEREAAWLAHIHCPEQSNPTYEEAA